jgi:predicted PurR-regulated permease PerM
MERPTRDLASVIRLVRWLLILAFVVLAYIVLDYLAHVLAPLLAALGIAYLLNPILDALTSRGMRRTVGAGLLLVTFLGIVTVSLVFAIPAITEQVTEFIHNLPRYGQNLSDWAESRFGIAVPDDWKAWLESPDAQHTLGDASTPLRIIATAIVGGLFSVLGVLAEMLLVPVFAFYFLADWPHLWRRLDHVVPPRRRATIRELVRQIDGVVSNWVRGQAIVTTILAILYAIGFTIVGMPLSVPVGLVVGALTVIPFVGTAVGAVIAVLVTISGGGSFGTVGAVAVVIVVLHILEAGVLTPKIVGHRVGLSESAALLAVVAGGKLLGFVGVVLAVPLAATFAVLVRYAIKYYETTAFYGHESDADVVITPAMALIMPGQAWSWDGEVIDRDHPSLRDLVHAIAQEAAKHPGLEGDDWNVETELGPSGKPE